MKCWYMNGAGNDFMVIDSRGLSPDYEALAKTLCAQTGADGFMAIDYSEIADFKLHFYNSDGSRGEMCGNGSRCICKLRFDLGIAGESMTVETDAGLVYGWRISENQYRVRLNDPTVWDPARLPGVSYIEEGDPGLPHAVTELPGLTWDMREALRERAAALRRSPAFPKGANVSFYTWLGDAEVRVLTYERGVEDYTLACGTGCGAVAAALRLSGQLPSGRLTAHNPGGTLHVTTEGTDTHITALLLEGPAEVNEIFTV